MLPDPPLTREELFPPKRGLTSKQALAIGDLLRLIAPGARAETEVDERTGYVTARFIGYEWVVNEDGRVLGWNGPADS